MPEMKRNLNLFRFFLNAFNGTGLGDVLIANPSLSSYRSGCTWWRALALAVAGAIGSARETRCSRRCSRLSMQRKGRCGWKHIYTRPERWENGFEKRWCAPRKEVCESEC